MNWGYALMMLGILALIILVIMDNYKDGKRINKEKN